MEVDCCGSEPAMAATGAPRGSILAALQIDVPPGSARPSAPRSGPAPAMEIDCEGGWPDDGCREMVRTCISCGCTRIPSEVLRCPVCAARFEPPSRDEAHAVWGERDHNEPLQFFALKMGRTPAEYYDALRSFGDNFKSVHVARGSSLHPTNTPTNI